MKKYAQLIMAIFLLLMASNSTNAQRRNYTPEKGFWVLESNIHNKKDKIVRFYNEDTVLIYQEKIAQSPFSIHSKRNLLYLNNGLKKAMFAWTNYKEILKSGNLMAVLIKEKGRKTNRLIIGVTCQFSKIFQPY